MTSELKGRLPLDVRLSRASTRAKIALVRAVCRASGVFGATRFLLSTIDWGELRTGRPSVLCLYRPLFAKDLEQLRRRTNVNWIYVNNEFLGHVQSAWVPPEMCVEAEYQKYHLPQYEKYWALLEGFGTAFLQAVRKRWPIDAVLTSHIDYWHGEGVRLGTRRLGIPFLALCREHMCLPIEQESVRRFFTGFKWEGDTVAVFGQSTKDIFVNSGACTAEQVVVTGPPRLDIWREVEPSVEPHDLVVLLSYRDPDYRAPRSFVETLRIFRDVHARCGEEAVFWVKSKDAKDTEEIRAHLGSTERNFVVDHDTPLYELFPRARLVVGFNSLSLVEAMFTRARVAIPCWGDADRPREELMFDPGDEQLRRVIDFAASPAELAGQLELAARAPLEPAASAAERLEVVRRIFHIPENGSCSRQVERFVTSQIRARARAPVERAPAPAVPRPAAHAWAPAACFIASIAVAALAALLGAPAFVNTVLAAPVYYAVPFGIGLLLTQLFEAGLTRTQRAMLAYLAGLVLVCALLVAREQARPAYLSIHLVSALLLVAATGGFALGHRFFAWNGAARTFAKDFVIVLPVFAIGLLVRFGVFSEYPVTDLFQATHLMKGSQEFGRFDILNPFTADSYAPAIQVMEGLMVRYFGFDVLAGAWILPVLAMLPKFVAWRAAFQSVLRTRESCLFATAVAACFLSVITPTNGDLAALGTLALFSLVVSSASDGRASTAGWVLAAGFGALALGYFAARSAPLVFVAVLVAAAALPATSRVLRLPGALLALPLLVIALAPLHRSTIAFVPLALAIGVLLPLLNAWLERQRAGAQLVGVGVGAVTAIAGAWTIGLLAWILVYPGDDMREAALYDWLLAVLLGATASGPNVVVGAGPKVALFELGRAMSPSFAVLAGICVTLGFLQVVRWPGLTRGAGWNAARQSLVAWGLAVALGGLLLIGVPFVYRSGFLVIVLLAIALAAAFDSFVEARAKLLHRMVLVVVATYVVGVIPLAYRCGAITRCISPEYLELISPFVVALGAIVLGAAILGVVFAHGGRVFRYGTQAALVLLFALEIGINRAYFMPYAVGAKRVTDEKAVSHLSRPEIALAAELRKRDHPVVLVSDPFTMANLRALTGLNSVVTFANLDTLSPVGDARLRAWLRDVIAPQIERTACAEQHPLDITYDSANGAEFNYWFARLTRGPGVPGRDILRAFGYRESLVPRADPALQRRTSQPPDHEWRRRAMLDGLQGEPVVLLVIDQKTVAWARGDDLSYFPDVRPLDPELISSLRERCPVEVHDGRFAVIPFSLDAVVRSEDPRVGGG